MKILVTGATGFIGSHIITALLESKHEVTACIHKKGSNKRSINVLAVNYSEMNCLEDWLPLLKGFDVVINSVGIITETKEKTFEQLHFKAPVALFKACEQLEINKVVQISALGADKTAIVPYHLSKKAADDILRETKLDWYILRPSLVYGKGGASFSLFKRLSNLPAILLFGDGKQQIQPVHISDVIDTVLRCLEPDAESQQIIDVVGKEAVTYQEWLLALRTNPAKPLFIRLPIKVMIQLAHFGKLINLTLIAYECFNKTTLQIVAYLPHF